MEHRPRSPTFDAPEVVPDELRSTHGFVSTNGFQYYDPPSSAYDRRASPAPQYRQDDTSPRISAQSPPPVSEFGQSPHRSDSRFSHTRTVSPLITYTEDHASAPEVIYEDGEKEVVYNEQRRSKVPSYHTYPTPGIRHQNSGDRPQVWTPVKQEEYEDDEADEKSQQQKRPFYKRWPFVLIAVILVLFVAVGIALGVFFARRHSGSGPSTSIGPNKLGVDLNTAVGGDVNNAYYSKSGAFNGSGIAIAAANTEYDQSIYAYYQDYQGTIQYALMDPQAKWSLVGPVNSGSYQALNGTPLSAVQHQLGNKLVWHLFYIDVNLIIRERIITNITTNGPSPIWTDGPLNALNLKAWNSTSIGMQACYWGNYYGAWSYDTNSASAGIHLWYASDATTFQQYSWTNGTDSWSRDRQWTGLSGNAGVGCQTWDTGTSECSFGYRSTLANMRQLNMCGSSTTVIALRCIGKTTTRLPRPQQRILSVNGLKVINLSESCRKQC